MHSRRSISTVRWKGSVSLLPGHHFRRGLSVHDYKWLYFSPCPKWELLENIFYSKKQIEDLKRYRHFVTYYGHHQWQSFSEQLRNYSKRVSLCNERKRCIAIIKDESCTYERMRVRYENIRTDGQTQYVAQPAFTPPQVTGPVLLFWSTPPSVSTSTPLTD